MSKPIYLLRLDGPTIDGDVVTGTGKQLVKILKILKPTIGSDDLWFVADVETVVETSNTITLSRSQNISKLGTIEDILSFATSVAQFLSGVFLVFSKWDAPSDLLATFFMDDEPFSDIQNAYFKIVAFDTCWFEIYAKQAYLLENLARVFNCQILTEADN